MSLRNYLPGVERRKLKQQKENEAKIIQQFKKFSNQKITQYVTK